MVSCIYVKFMLMIFIFLFCILCNCKLFYCEMFIFINGVYGVGEYLDWCYCECFCLFQLEIYLISLLYVG